MENGHNEVTISRVALLTAITLQFVWIRHSTLSIYQPRHGGCKSQQASLVHYSINDWGIVIEDTNQKSIYIWVQIKFPVKFF